MKRRRTILVVEDDAALAAMYRSALRFSGCEVEVATDGFSALWHVEHHRPDLVVLDLHLPGLRGEAILSEIAQRADMRGVTVVVVTGDDTHAAIAQAAAVLRKPCPPEHLLSVVERHITPAA